MVAAALPLVASFVVSIVLAPWFGDRLFGIYLLSMSIATFALIPAKFGIQVATSRLLSEHEEEAGSWLRAGLLLRLAFTLPTAALLFAIAPLLTSRLGDPTDGGAFAMATAIVVSTSIFEFATEALVGLRAFRAQLATRMVAMVLRLAGVFAVRYGGYSVAVFLAAHSIAFLLPGLVALGVLFVRCRGASTAAHVRRTLEVATPMAFASASFLIYSHTDRLMLGWLRGPEQVGQFGVARNVIDAALFPVAALTWSLRPALVRALKTGGIDGMRPALAEGTRLSILYTVLAVGLLAPIGDLVIPGLFTDTYRAAGWLFLGLMPVFALRALTTVVFPGMLALDQQRRYSHLMTLTAGMNVVLNLALIPGLGAWGAILATVASLLVLGIGGWWQLRQRGCTGFIRVAMRGALPALLAAVAGAVGLTAARLQGVDWHILLGAALGYGVLAAVLLLRQRPPGLAASGNPDLPDAP